MHAATLPPTGRKLLLTLHVATAASVLGADLVLLLLGIAGLGGADPRMIFPVAHLIAGWLIAPLAILALGTGALLGALTQWGLFQYWWVTIKLALTAILTAVILFVLVPRLGAVAAVMNGSSPTSLSTAERIPLVAAPALGSSLLLLALALAIFKPGWRLRSREPQAPIPLSAGPR